MGDPELRAHLHLHALLPLVFDPSPLPSGGGRGRAPNCDTPPTFAREVRVGNARVAFEIARVGTVSQSAALPPAPSARLKPRSTRSASLRFLWEGGTELR